MCDSVQSNLHMVSQFESTPSHINVNNIIRWVILAQDLALFPTSQSEHASGST